MTVQLELSDDEFGVLVACVVMALEPRSSARRGAETFLAGAPIEAVDALFDKLSAACLLEHDA